MKKFSIPELDNKSIEIEVGEKLKDYKLTSPYPSFCKMLIRACLILDSRKAKISRPALLVIASDHGFIKESKTHLEVYQHLESSSLLAKMSKSSGFHLKTIDLGVRHSFERSLSFWLHHGKGIVDWKINKGTKNFKEFPAMTSAECQKAIDIGIKLAQKEFKIGSKLIAVQSLGEGGEFSAQIIASGLLEKEIQKGLISYKIEDAVQKALACHPKTHDPITLISLFGGYELASIMGLILQAASQKQILFLGGLKSILALYIASLWHPGVLDYVMVVKEPENELEGILYHKMKLLVLNHHPIDGNLDIALCQSLSLLKSGIAILRD